LTLKPATDTIMSQFHPPPSLTTYFPKTHFLIKLPVLAEPGGWFNTVIIKHIMISPFSRLDKITSTLLMMCFRMRSRNHVKGNINFWRKKKMLKTEKQYLSYSSQKNCQNSPYIK
jgi:hypothetical protein